MALLPRVIVRKDRNRYRIVAMSNGRNLASALQDFAEDYGGLPDRETAAAVMASSRTKLDLSGDSANSYFRQLIAAGVVKSEDPFSAPFPGNSRRPDNHMEGAEALKAGEVGFSSLMDGERGMPTEGPWIVAVAPAANANGEFDPRSRASKGCAVCMDGSVREIVIDRKSRKALLEKGKSLLNTGEGTPWGDTIHPVIKAPEMRNGVRSF